MKEYRFELILGATLAKALRLRAAVLVAFFATALLTPLSSSAQSGDAESLAKAAQNPIADMISLPLQNNTNFDFGPLKKTQNILNIQPVYPVNLNAEWNLITRTIVPVISQPALTSGEDRTFGIGSCSSRPSCLRSRRWADGFGEPARSRSLIPRLTTSSAKAHGALDPQP